jgi:hypothetical protein
VIRSPIETASVGAIAALIGLKTCSGFNEGCGIVASFDGDRDAIFAAEGGNAEEPSAVTADPPVANKASVVEDCRIHASQSKKRETIKTINKIERRVSIRKLTFESVLHRSGLGNRIVAGPPAWMATT